MKSKYIVAILCLLSVIFLLSPGCKQKPPTTGKPVVLGVIVVGGGALLTSDSTVTAQVEIDGSKSLPVVTINSESLYLSDYYTYYNSFADVYLWDSEWRKERLGVALGKKCVLNVSQLGGDASSDSVVVPLPITLTSPGGGFTLKAGNPLPIAWSGTTGIERYSLTINIDYYYRDTANQYRSFSLDTSLYLPGTITSFTLPATTIFPAYVDTVFWGDGMIELVAETGCKEGKNPEGNIKGNGYGYFWAYNYTYCTFDISARLVSASTHFKPDLSEIAKKVLQQKKVELGIK